MSGLSRASAARRSRVSTTSRVAGAAQRAVRAEGFLVPGIDALPAQRLFQMLGEGRLNQPVFAVDVGVGHAFSAYS